MLLILLSVFLISITKNMHGGGLKVAQLVKLLSLGPLAL